MTIRNLLIYQLWYIQKAGISADDTIYGRLVRLDPEPTIHSTLIHHLHQLAMVPHQFILIHLLQFLDMISNQVVLFEVLQYVWLIFVQDEAELLDRIHPLRPKIVPFSIDIRISSILVHIWVLLRSVLVLVVIYGDASLFVLHLNLVQLILIG